MLANQFRDTLWGCFSVQSWGLRLELKFIQVDHTSNWFWCAPETPIEHEPEEKRAARICLWPFLLLFTGLCINFEQHCACLALASGLFCACFALALRLTLGCGRPTFGQQLQLGPFPTRAHWQQFVAPVRFHLLKWIRHFPFSIGQLLTVIRFLLLASYLPLLVRRLLLMCWRSSKRRRVANRSC